MHTAEHLLNQTMVRMFCCDRSKNTHIERKKSKCDYHISDTTIDDAKIAMIEDAVNEQISRNLQVEAVVVGRDKVPASVDLSKLPADASDSLRIVTIGDYDVCACIGDHVSNTSQIGKFKITTFSHENGILRIRFKLEATTYEE